MKLVPGRLPGLAFVEPRVFRDDRGFFLESFNEERFAELGLPTHFAQDNHSHSKQRVLRGLHYQVVRPQGKLVTVTRGSIFDVAVDIREGSATFGQWQSTILDAAEPKFFWIPPGFAHGFCVLSDVADFLYKCTEVYVPEHDRAIRWNDPTLGVQWPIDEPLLSAKDAAAPLLRDAELPRIG